MGRLKVYLVFLFVLAGTYYTSAAQEIERVSKTVDAEGAKKIEVDIDFAAGELDLKTADMPEAAKVDIDYTPRFVRYDVDYRLRGETGQLFLKSSHRKRFFDDDDSENSWKVVLSSRYPTEMKFEMGACDSRVDLGGLQLTRLEIEAGATGGTIDFSKPNPIRMDELTMEIGASSVDVLNLANANCDHMEIEVGAGSCELDFRGEFKGETDLYLEVGVGSASLIIPRDLSIRLEGDDGWFSSIDFHGLHMREVDDGIWESEGYDQARERLTVKADVAMGTLDIYAKR